MTSQTLTLVRKILLLLAGALLGATLVLFFLSGKLNVGGVFIALACFAVFFYTGRKQTPGRQ